MRRYSPREVSKAVGCHIRTVQRAILRGELEAWKTGNGKHYWHVGEDALRRWVASKACGLDKPK